MGGQPTSEGNTFTGFVEALRQGLLPDQNNKLKDGSTFDPGKLDAEWERKMDKLGLGQDVQNITGWKYTYAEIERPEREARAAEEASIRNIRAARGGRVALVTEDETAAKLGV